MHQSILCEGSILSGSSLRSSILGIRALVQEGSVIEHSIVMGATYFEIPGSRPGPAWASGATACCSAPSSTSTPASATASRLVNAAGVDDAEEESYSIRDGIIVVHRDGVIPPGTEI